MRFRYGTLEDLNTARKIWENSFYDTEEFVDFYFKDVYPNKDFLILEEENEVLSSLYENSHFIYLNGHRLETRYLVGVATEPEHRNRGFMKHLVEFSLKEMRSKNLDLAILTPINPDIYRKFGFEYFSSIVKYSYKLPQEIEFSDVSDKKLLKDIRTVKITEENFELYINDIKSIYECSMNGKKSYLERDTNSFKTIFKELLADKMELYLFFNKEKASSYVMLGYEDRKIEVREIFAKELMSYKAMLVFINNFKDYFDEVEIFTEKDSEILFYFKNQKEIKKEENPYMMARVLNPKAILERLNLFNSDIKIYITDSLFEENEGIYTLSKEIEFKKNTEDYDFKIDISNLSMLIFGYISVENLLKLGKISFKNDEKIETLQKIFPISSSYLFENY